MQEKKKIQFLIKEIFSVVSGMLVAAFFINHIGIFAIVSGDSMLPALTDGQMVYASKISYGIYEPERFDIVIVQSENAEDYYLVKRVIALPGEVVRIDEKGVIYINGRVLEEDYGLAAIENPGIAKAGIYLGENEYFVLGDNRNISLDSRNEAVGLIQKDNIIAKVSEIF